MSSTERVRAALDFRVPDYVPLIDVYWWEFVNRWRRRSNRKPLPGLPYDDVVEDFEISAHYGVDIIVVVPDEAPWPNQVESLAWEGPYRVYRDGWGRIMRGKPGAEFAARPLQVRLQSKTELDGLVFDPVHREERYGEYLERIDRLSRGSYQPYVATKVGGPFFRPTHLRGFMQWLLDLAEDPEFAEALCTRVTDHLISIGLEAMARSGLWHSSIWIFDDCADNDRLLISPSCYEKIVLPQLGRMVKAFKEAGVAHVIYHSDGDIRTILDGLVEIGIDGVNPVEPRAHMDVAELRKRYGKRLALLGGLCNSRVLPFGTDCEVRTHVERTLEAAQEGGLVIGTHSIGPDITPERYELLMQILAENGRPLPPVAVSPG
jgi:uroporphyrinogen decarboxylase